MALILDIGVGDAIEIDNGRIILTLREKRGKRASVVVDAHRSVPIRHIERGEVVSRSARRLSPLESR